MCFEGVNRCFVFCLSFSPLLDHLNPKQIRFTFLSCLSPHFASLMRAERARAHTRRTQEAQRRRILQRRKDYGACLLISTRREHAHTVRFCARFIYKYLSRKSFCFPAKSVDFFPFMFIIPGRRAETSLSLSATTRTRNRSHQRPNLRPRTIGTT